MLQAKIKKLEKRIEELEKVAHPQHVLADPELTEAIKHLAAEGTKFLQPRVPFLPILSPDSSGSPSVKPGTVFC